MKGTGKEAGLSRDLETPCGALHSRVSIDPGLANTNGEHENLSEAIKALGPLQIGFQGTRFLDRQPIFLSPSSFYFYPSRSSKTVSEGEKKKKASQVQVLDLLLTGSISYLIFPSHGQVFHLQNGHKNSPCLSRLRQRENKTTAVNHPAQSLTQELEAIFSSISSFTQLNASIAPTGVLLNACRFLLSISFFPV